MELAQVVRTLYARRLAVLGICAISVVVGVLAAYKPDGLSLKPRTESIGVATKQFILESPQSPLTDLRPDSEPQNARTGAFAQVLGSPAILEGIERKTGIAADSITTEGPFVEAPNSPGIVRPSEVRGLEISDEEKDYRLRFITPVDLPIVSIYARGPNAVEAGRLADGAYAALLAYLKPLEDSSLTYPVRLRDLGPAKEGTLGGGMGKAVAILGAGATLLLGLLLLVCVDVAIRGLRPPVRMPIAATGPRSVGGPQLAGRRPRGPHTRVRR